MTGIFSKCAERGLFSPCYGGQLVNSKFWGCLDQLRAFGQMLCELGIVVEPPKCIRRENEMCRAATTQLLEIGSRLLTVARIASVNRVFLLEMPTLSLRVVKYRRIARIRGDNQRIGRGNSVQFQTSIAQLSGGRFIKWSH